MTQRQFIVLLGEDSAITKRHLWRGRVVIALNFFAIWLNLAVAVWESALGYGWVAFGMLAFALLGLPRGLHQSMQIVRDLEWARRMENFYMELALSV